mmetsp:Transcript_126884/g.371022  ORF Transcript_126884/g.371022 Transcript_126884/m.371022 type:complete len:454 (+) Transcript_126884:41-1402(+)
MFVRNWMAIRRSCTDTAVRHGFWPNKMQVVLQLVLAVLIGVSQRLVLLPAALLSDSSSKSDFLIFFGVAKAISGELGGVLADRWSRKHACMLGWLCGIVIVPVLLLGIRLRSPLVKDLADALLGVQQGLTWGVNIISLMDILGPRGRGMASALSNAIGYAASTAAARVAAQLVSETGDEEGAVYYLAVVICMGVGVLAVSRDTRPWIEAEETIPVQDEEAGPGGSHACATGCGTLAQALCSIAGLTVNTATGLVWGAMVMWAREGGLSNAQIGDVEACHTAAKVLAMLGAGAAIYRCSPRLVAAASLALLVLGLSLLLGEAWAPSVSVPGVVLASCLVGAGVGGAFPALAAAVSADLPASSRASVYGAYRMWRDFGYAVGGLSQRLFDWDGFRSTSLSVLILAAAVAGLFGAHAACHALGRAADSSKAEAPSSSSDEYLAMESSTEASKSDSD